MQHDITILDFSKLPIIRKSASNIGSSIKNYEDNIKSKTRSRKDQIPPSKSKLILNTEINLNKVLSNYNKRSLIFDKSSFKNTSRLSIFTPFSTPPRLLCPLAIAGLLYTILRTIIYCKRTKCRNTINNNNNNNNINNNNINNNDINPTTIPLNTSRGTNHISCLRLIILLLWISILPTILAHHQDHQACPGCPRERDHHVLHHHHHSHNHHNINHHTRQQSKTTESGRKNGGSTNERDIRNDPSPDDLRLEAIKHQILTKLGLRGRPDVNKTLASVPRNLALQTLYRAEAQPQPLSPSVSQSSTSSKQNHQQTNTVYRHRGGIYREDSYNVESHSYGEFNYGSEEFSYKNMEQSTERTTIVTETLSSSSSSTTSTTTTPSYKRGYGENDDDNEQGEELHLSENDSADDRSGDEQQQEELDDFYARTSEIITFAEPGHTLNGQPLLEFPMSTGEPVLGPLRIKKATLWARVELRRAHQYQHHRPGQNHQRNITLWVFRVRCGNATHLRGKELGQHLDMVTSLGVNIGQLGWQKFDVTSVVMDWYSGGAKIKKDKLTLLVDCTGCGLHVHVSTFGHASHEIEPSLNAQGAEDPDRPFLVVHTDPTGVKRIRRRAVECSGPLMGQCCKQRFYVNFSQLGWDDWIIAPQGYYANYCRGDCGAGHRTPDTFLNYYTHVIEEYRKMDRLAGMQPCCAPLKFSSISLIYYGPDSNIIKRDLPKMVVDECGCP